MRAFLAITHNELFQRRWSFATAMLLGLVPLLLPHLPGLDRYPRGVLVGSGAIAVALAFVVGATLAVGSGTLAPEIAEDRLGFYFSRPISTHSLWTGKWLAALLTVGGGGLLILAPAMLTRLSRRELLAALATAQLKLGDLGPGSTLASHIGLLAAATVLALATTHLVASMLRLPSAWLVLDVLAIATAAVGGWWCLRTIGDAWWYDFGDLHAWWFAILVATAALIAGWAQAVFGRSDRRRGRSALSIALALSLLVAYAPQILAPSLAAFPTLGRLKVLHTCFRAPESDWVVVAGFTPYVPHSVRFAWNPSTGREVYLGPYGHQLHTAVSADGSRLAIVRARRVGLGHVRSDENVVSVFDLTSGTITHDFAIDDPVALVFSPFGDRLAILTPSYVWVKDLDGARDLRRRNPEVKERWTWSAALAFSAPESVRVFGLASIMDSKPGRTFVEVLSWDLDLAAESPLAPPEPTVRRSPRLPFGRLTIDVAGSLVTAGSALLDGTTLELLAQAPRRGRIAIVDDARLVATHLSNVELRAYDGTILQRAAVDGPLADAIARTADGSIVLRSAKEPPLLPGRRSARSLWKLSDAGIERLARGLKADGPLGGGPTLPERNADVFLTDQGDIVRLDYRTGEVDTLLEAAGD